LSFTANGTPASDSRSPRAIRASISAASAATSASVRRVIQTCGWIAS
jgi:hypothetical protein